MTTKSGQTLSHYRFVEKIGEGGMGVVWKALDTTLDREVAIKVLPAEVAADSDRIRRFEREAKAVAKLDHPNILAIFDFGSEEGVTYAVMELLEGQPLREVLREGGLTPGKAVEYAQAITSGLAAAHDKGIVHRDLKPENVFLTRDGRIKILDFGLAKLKLPEVDLTTETPTAMLDTAPGGLIGTVPYMAPEQVQGRAADHRADIFALGVVLYEMLTGQRPFRGSTGFETAAAILREDPEPISVAAPSVPHTLANVVSKCLEKRPEDRFCSARDLALTLGAIDSSASVRPIQWGPIISKRWPPFVAVVIAAAIALVLVLRPPGLFKRSTVHPGEAPRPRIVVLPFENLGSRDDDYFADGMTEELISRLATVSGLQVISRTSSMHYKDTDKTLGQIGEELDVAYALEGTVLRERGAEGKGRLRITPKLIRVSDDTHVWSERYDRVLEDVFTVQSDIAQQVIDELEVALLEPERHAIEALPTDNMEAYQAYLLGIQYAQRIELEKDRELAVGLLERAVGLDPEFALAHAALAVTHASFIHFRYDVSPVRFAKAELAAERAFHLAPDLPEVRISRGQYFYWVFRDYDRALSEYRIAAEQRPGDGRVFSGIGYFLRRQGRWNEALVELEKGLRLDPQNAGARWIYALSHTYLRNYETAVEHFERALSMAPDLIEPYYRLAWTYRLWDGSPERARAALESMPRETNPVAIYSWLDQELYERECRPALERLHASPVSVFSLPRRFLPTALIECECLLELARSEEAKSVCERAVLFLEEAVEERPGDPRVHSALGKAYALVGRKDEGIHHGEAAVAIWPVGKDAIDGTYFEMYLAEIYALAGESDLAVSKLDFLLSIPSLVSVADLRANPKWSPLRDHPRFQALLEKYGEAEERAAGR